MKANIFWFRRDLRLEDNTALNRAFADNLPVLPVFIFDTSITEELPKDDARISFIYDQLKSIDDLLKKSGGGVVCLKGEPINVWRDLVKKYPIEKVYSNRDYEPYAIDRDEKVKSLLKENNIEFIQYKDQVIFDKDEVMKDDGTPYTVFTPYKRKWLQHFESIDAAPKKNKLKNLYSINTSFPTLQSLGFEKSSIKVKDYDLSELKHYPEKRDFPNADATSYLSPHLRFGTVSVRQIIQQLKASDEVFLSELIWREFFMQILYHFPHVVNNNFNDKYDSIEWRNDEHEFDAWCKGKTGYPLVDAGMRQLNTTGYMHNRVRMVVASFLCKHLLIDWRWGEAYFAKKLLDYELSSNNGNWQWAAGTGCDAAPYFRIFNPEEQLKKFDRNFEYVKKWVPEVDTESYPLPMIDHKFARQRALDTYKIAVS